MAFTRFSTSEPWDPASGARLNKLGDELQEQINVLNEEEIIPITYLNGFKQIWGGQVCVRKGNEITLYLEINKESATDLSQPVMMLKYKPTSSINTLAITDTSTISYVSVVAEVDGRVLIHPWSHAFIGNNTIVTLKYTTREAFK